MRLVDLNVPLPDRDLPADVDEFLQAAHTRIDVFLGLRRGGSIPAFVPSDFAQVYHVLTAILAGNLAAGRRFCEWGSGFGVVASLAAMLDLDACGIEIEAELVAAADDLAREFQVPVEFIHGSFIPHGGNPLTDSLGDVQWLSTDGDSAYDQMDLEVDDFDIIFAYPWPGEEGVIETLFLRYAAAGAILVTYHGVDGSRVRRKIERPRQRRR